MSTHRCWVLLTLLLLAVTSSCAHANKKQPAQKPASGYHPLAAIALQQLSDARLRDPQSELAILTTPFASRDDFIKRIHEALAAENWSDEARLLRFGKRDGADGGYSHLIAIHRPPALKRLREWVKAQRKREQGRVLVLHKTHVFAVPADLLSQNQLQLEHLPSAISPDSLKELLSGAETTWGSPRTTTILGDVGTVGIQSTKKLRVGEQQYIFNDAVRTSPVHEHVSTGVRLECLANGSAARGLAVSLDYEVTALDGIRYAPAIDGVPFEQPQTRCFADSLRFKVEGDQPRLFHIGTMQNGLLVLLAYSAERLEQKL